MGDVAAVVGGHPNTTRHHLRALTASGLVDARRDPGPLRSRPPTRCRECRGPSGARRRARRPVGGECLELVGAFADRLAAHEVDAGESPGRWGGPGGPSSPRATCRNPGADPRGRVIELLDRLGFSPRPSSPGPVPDPDEVELRTCPLLDAAQRHPQVVCQVHAGFGERGRRRVRGYQ